MREGGENSLRYLKRVWNRKEGRGTMVLKREKLGLKDGCLKKERGGGNPLTSYEIRKLYFRKHIGNFVSVIRIHQKMYSFFDLPRN